MDWDAVLVKRVSGWRLIVCHFVVLPYPVAPRGSLPTPMSTHVNLGSLDAIHACPPGRERHHIPRSLSLQELRTVRLLLQSITSVVYG